MNYDFEEPIPTGSDTPSGPAVQTDPPAPAADPAQTVLDPLPPTQTGRADSYSNGMISVIGLSLQGASHVKKNIPCQDYCNYLYIDELNLLVAAVADGVGSCALSHWGSYTAVESALSFLKNALLAPGEDGRPRGMTSSQEGARMMREAFSAALNAVEDKAAEMQRMPYSFQSTLTVAIYDGKAILYGHAGDDGIVAQQTDGTYAMTTSRMKGDEAASVCPLQIGPEKWQVGITIREDVSGFIMATDGVLDSFVDNAAHQNRVYYPFMESVLYPLCADGENPQENARQSLEKLRKTLLSDEYRCKVTDDITLLAVTNNMLMNNSTHPVFDQKKWDEDTAAYTRRLNEKLYGKSRQSSADTRKKPASVPKPAPAAPTAPAASAPPPHSTMRPNSLGSYAAGRKSSAHTAPPGNQSIPHSPQKAPVHSSSIPVNPTRSSWVEAVTDHAETFLTRIATAVFLPSGRDPESLYLLPPGQSWSYYDSSIPHRGTLLYCEKCKLWFWTSARQSSAFFCPQCGTRFARRESVRDTLPLDLLSY